MAGEHSGLPTLDFQDDPDPGGGSGGQQPQNVKNSAQVKSGPVRTGWLNTMETLIDSGVLTWDISGLILMTPENGSILIDALKVLEPQWKNPLVNFKKNMSNYLFKMAPDRGRLMYTNPYYNREFRHAVGLKI